ncbi:MAG: class I adenylate-forming enzyme family protein [Bacteriovoracia bacterium]
MGFLADLRNPTFGRLLFPETGEIFSPAEIRARVESRKSEFHAQGIEPGARVLYPAHSTVGTLVDLFALWSLEACVCLFDPRASAWERTRFLQASCANCFWNGMVLEKIASTSEPAHWQKFKNPALISFSSGSSGTPKAVVHGREGLEGRIFSLQKGLSFRAEKAALCLLPLSFVHGLLSNSLTPWLAGLDLALLAPPVSARLGVVSASVDRYEIDFLSSTPSFWTLVNKFGIEPPVRKLKRLNCGSAPLSVTGHEMMQKWGAPGSLWGSYGLTEFGTWVGGGKLDTYRVSPVDECWGVEHKIEEGQLYLRSPHAMQGYLGHEPLPAGWFPTGDLAQASGEGFTVSGRISSFINVAGAKVDPLEVVEALKLRFPGISEAVAVGIPHDIYGEVVAVAFVADSSIEESALRSEMRNGLSAAKVPRYWTQVKELPMLRNGKVNFTELKELFLKKKAEL